MDGDTIVAISTGTGYGAIGIVRLSGPDALGIAARIFKSQRGNDASCMETFSLSYGHVVEPSSGRNVDEVLLGVMRAPRSYTREDVAEFHCHGGAVAVRSVLRVAVEAGARIAEPGEFTRRAFINGRIDLAQAESVADIVSARSAGALRAALRQLDGGLSSRVSALRGALVEALATIEASVDFSDEEVDEVDWEATRGLLSEVRSGVDQLLGTALLGRALECGVNVAIVGKPNVGKSSLLNALVMRERAIVSETPGTTRDTVEEDLEIGGIPIRLVDTAGIRSHGGSVEQMGIERSLRALEQADLAIVVVDLTDQDVATGVELARGGSGRPCIVVGNKADLVGWGSEALQRLEAAVRASTGGRGVDESEKMWVLDASAKTGEGVDDVRRALEEGVSGGMVDVDDPILVGERQRALVAEADAYISKGLAAIDVGKGEELVAEDIKLAAVSLGRITGEELGTDLLDEIFGRFCIGK